MSEYRIKQEHSISQYEELLNIEYPFENTIQNTRRKMPVSDRAKIFASFAALKGYEEAIASKEKIIVPRIELAEDSMEYLNQQLTKIEQLLNKQIHPIVTIVYFYKEMTKVQELGEYILFTGVVSKYEKTSHILQIIDKRFKLEDIYKIYGEDLEA